MTMRTTTPSAANVRNFVDELDDRLAGPSVRSTPTHEGLDMLLQVAHRLEELEGLVQRLKLQLEGY
jgi:hypothetical protein